MEFVCDRPSIAPRPLAMSSPRCALKVPPLAGPADVVALEDAAVPASFLQPRVLSSAIVAGEGGRVTSCLSIARWFPEKQRSPNYNGGVNQIGGQSPSA